MGPMWRSWQTVLLWASEATSEWTVTPALPETDSVADTVRGPGEAPGLRGDTGALLGPAPPGQAEGHPPRSPRRSRHSHAAPWGPSHPDAPTPDMLPLALTFLRNDRYADVRVWQISTVKPRYSCSQNTIRQMEPLPGSNMGTVLGPGREQWPAHQRRSAEGLRGCPYPCEMGHLHSTLKDTEALQVRWGLPRPLSCRGER